jgi:hypothetical protein
MLSSALDPVVHVVDTGLPLDYPGALHLLLGAQTPILVLASVDRLSSATHAQVCRSMPAPVL